MLSSTRLWLVNCELINGLKLCAKLEFCSGSGSSLSGSPISSTSKAICGPICKCLELIGVKSSNELLSLTTRGPQGVDCFDELGWTMDGSWRCSILIFIASLFVLLAWLGLENAVDKRGPSLGLLSWISSFKSIACVDSWTELRWYGNSHNNVQYWQLSLYFSAYFGGGQNTDPRSMDYPNGLP